MNDDWTKKSKKKGIKQIEFSLPRQKGKKKKKKKANEEETLLETVLRAKNFYEEKWVMEFFKQN